MAADPRRAGPDSAIVVRVRVELEAFTLEIDEELASSGVTAIFGASGSGKSTLLRAIAGFETPTRGRIAQGGDVWFDADLGIDVPAHRRPIGLLFQDARLFDHLDVSGNLEFGARRRGARPDAGPGLDRVDLVRALDLAPLLARRVAALSGGERQRVALARTLLTRPSLLLLDEPLSAVDRSHKAEIVAYLAEAVGGLGIPALLVTHDLEEVAQLADRVCVVEDGQLQTEGPVGEVIDRLDASSELVRSEASTLLEGVVVAHDARLRLSHVDVHGDRLAIPLVERAAVGDRLRIRVRARDVAVATRRPEGLSIRNVLPGRIVALRPIPERGAVEVRIRLREDVLRARLTLAAVEALELEEGDPVHALVKSISLDPR